MAEPPPRRAARSCHAGPGVHANEKYAALVESAGYIPVALSADDYIEMLPATWRAVNAYGIKISHRIYDSDELNPFRRQPSGVTRENLWEVHRDRHHTHLIPSGVPAGDAAVTGTRAAPACLKVRKKRRRGEHPVLAEQIG